MCILKNNMDPTSDWRFCQECLSDTLFIENGELCFVCTSCGFIDHSSMGFDARPVFSREDPWRAPFSHGVVCYGTSRGRYKEKFHHNERISQWRCQDPRIPSSDWERILTEAETEKYGSKEHLTRASVILICRSLNLNKYRERWKTILRKLNPDIEYDDPEDGFLTWAKYLFPLLVTSFKNHKATMPKSVTRGKDGSVKSKERHNFLSYNYVTRKQLEIWGDWRFHHEFPLPRSHTKLHALDDVWKKICEELYLPFSRSVVIKRPKIKVC